MNEIERLKTAADLYGFDLTLITSHDQITARDDPRPDYSIAVAAFAYDEQERFVPFNAAASGTARRFEREIATLKAAARRLARGGLLFVYGLPRHLMRYATSLSDDLEFRYWVAVRAMTDQHIESMRPEHTGLLILSRRAAVINRIRIPHARCRYCRETLKDWGGKSHLMHSQGVALSDVWMDLVVDSRERLPSEVLARILRLSPPDAGRRLLLIVPESETLAGYIQIEPRRISVFDPLGINGRKRPYETARSVPEKLLDQLHRGPCLEVLRQIPTGSIDLAFADPPFNLTKRYNGYSDNKTEREYVGWCKRWLVEYERVLKPGGAMFIVNLPRWAVWIAEYLSRSRDLYMQRWIVWNSLPEPKGVLMPAHYSLLYFTKGGRAARFNYCSMEGGWQPFDEAVFPPDRADVCQRRSCLKRRRASGQTYRGELTDIWHDIHRVRRPHPCESASRKAHPCATPERLVDRIIRLATNPGDIVLDGFAGTGTSAVVARRLGRRYIAIEQDAEYLSLANNRLRRSPSRGEKPARRSRSKTSKRRLQIELMDIAARLGRLPTRLDVEQLSQYSLEVFDKAFRTWSEALKAARMNAPSEERGLCGMRDELSESSGDEASGHA
jgi:site-specific DNA-methyltransferase (adenine-specific)